MKRRSTTKRRASPTLATLTFEDAVMRLSHVENAQSDLADTIDLLTLVIDADVERAGRVVVTFERHIKSDLAALEAAMKTAHDEILNPLRAAKPAEGAGEGQ